MNWKNIESYLGDEITESIKEEVHREKPNSRLLSIPTPDGNGFVLTLRGLRIVEKQLVYEVSYFLMVKNLVHELQSSEYGFKDQGIDYGDFLDLLDGRFDKVLGISYLYFDEVEKIEDQYYQRDFSSSLVKTWYDLKKDLSRLDRFLGRLEITVTDLLKYIKKASPDDYGDYENFLRDVSGLNQNIEGNIVRLDNANNYYTNLKNERLNKNIYALTLLSGIFLPLNLIVGFFGMNTEGLFFKENPQGTLYVVYILVGIFLLFVVGSSLFRLIDRLFIRWWLGRTKIHSRIVGRLEDFEERWKG